jgi:hypothetical protein
MGFRSTPSCMEKVRVTGQVVCRSLREIGSTSINTGLSESFTLRISLSRCDLSTASTRDRRPHVNGVAGPST